MRCSVREPQNLRPAMFTSTPIAKCKISLDFALLENSPIPKSQFNRLTIPETLVKYQNQARQPISIFRVLGKEKVPLYFEEKREHFLKKQSQSHPPMVIISDSEEEDNIDKEITSLQNMLNPTSTRKSVYKDVVIDHSKEENTKQIKNRNLFKPSKKEILETENKKSVKRVSRLAAIIDEVMKDRKSTIVAPSPMIKMKIENNLDAIAMEGKSVLRDRRVTRSSVLTSHSSNVMKETKKRNTYIPVLTEEGVSRKKTVEISKKIQNIGNEEKSNIRKTRKRTKMTSVKTEEKENTTQYEKDYEMKIKAEKILIPLKEKNIGTNIIQAENSLIPLKDKNTSTNNIQAETVKKPSTSGITSPSTLQKIEASVFSNIPLSKAEPFNETLPVLYKQEEIEDKQWIQLSDQKGIFIKKNFRQFPVSNGFVKIMPKCSLFLNSVKSQIFQVADGRGIFMDNNKIGPGHIITIPPGFSCKITNTGLKKNLVISFTKVGKD